MATVTVFAGLDYHDEAVRVCVLDPQGRLQGNRDGPNDWRALAGYVGRYGDTVKAALESCPGAADLAEELVSQAGWSVDLAHPGFVTRMQQNPDKTDCQDAQLLADLERVGYLPRVWLAPENVRELRRLVHYRQQLVNQRRAAKLRVRALLRDQRCRPPAGVNAWTRAWRVWLVQTTDLSAQSRWLAGKYLGELDRLAGDRRAVEARLGQVTADDAVVRQLQAPAGIGPVTAWPLRAEVGRCDRFRSGKQLARCCGLSPRNASSGQRQADAGLIQAANPGLRAVLIEAAHRLARLDPKWRTLAQRLRGAGKPGSVVAAAVANRWVRWLFHQMQPPGAP
jgi:transposase